MLGAGTLNALNWPKCAFPFVALCSKIGILIEIVLKLPKLELHVCPQPERLVRPALIVVV